MDVALLFQPYELFLKNTKKSSRNPFITTFAEKFKNNQKNGRLLFELLIRIED